MTFEIHHGLTNYNTNNSLDAHANDANVIVLGIIGS